MNETMNDKIAVAVERIRFFAGNNPEPLLVAFSGGKDSQVCYHLTEMAGVPFVAQYSITRFEPPEILQFVRKYYPSVTFRRAYKCSLTEEIEKSGLPNRWARWCCAAKHSKILGHERTIIGIRWEESPRRRDTWRMQGTKPDKTHYLCPICDWTEQDVWQFLGDRPHCALYDEGFHRIGCVCCPLSTPTCMARDVARWPKTAEMLRKASALYVEKMRKEGFLKKNGEPCSDWCRANNPEAEYWHRWIKSCQTSSPADSVRWDSDECLFAGSGFSETDSGITNE